MKSTDNNSPELYHIFLSLLFRIDIVDMALTYMAVEEEECKFKAICMAEQAAINNPIARLAINTLK